jgi:predicted metalloprotease
MRGLGGIGGRGLGVGGTVILLILSLVFGKDFLSMGGTALDEGAGPAPAESPVDDPAEEGMVRLLSVVLDSAQNYWQRQFAASGSEYQRARLVLFRDVTETGCGYGQAASGPFYCPADGKVYIDLSFFEELQSRFGAPGDFAQAYVLAHEIGHHVQNLTGTARQVHEARQRGSSNANELSVRLELQADCYAGVWAHQAAQQNMLEPGDAEEGLAAAAAVGDDRLQRQATGRVNPESWTHGSSEQRMAWFQRGFRGGSHNACDTFGG